MIQALRQSTIRVKAFNTAMTVSKPLGKVPSHDAKVRRGIKTAISKFTYSSKRMLLLWFCLYTDRLKVEITLTYGSDGAPTDGAVCRKHLKAIIMWLHRVGVKDYIWIREYQTRGSLHYHILVDRFVPYGRLREAWGKIIQEPYTEALTSVNAIRQKNRMGFYCTKYFGKEEQKQVPEGVINPGRWWGSNLPVVPTDHYEATFEDRKELADFFRPIDNWYDSQLRTWGKKAKKKYKRLSRQCGFTVYHDGKGLGLVAGRLLTYYGSVNLVLGGAA